MNRTAAPRERPSLVVRLHLRCTRSRTTLAALARLMAHAQGRLDPHCRRADRPSHGRRLELDLLDSTPRLLASPCCAMPTARAKRFGGATSGQTLLYDATGRPRFSGGITSARRHESDNAGRSSLKSLLTGGVADASSTEVAHSDMAQDFSPAVV